MLQKSQGGQQDAAGHSGSAAEKCGENGEDQRDHDAADAQVLRREDGKHAGDVGQDAGKRRVEEDGKAGGSHALAAAKVMPEREIMADGGAGAGENEGAAPEGAGEEEPAHEIRGGYLREVSREYKQARDESDMGHDICHAGVVAGADRKGGLPGIFPGHDLGSQDIAEEIADQKTEKLIHGIGLLNCFFHYKTEFAGFQLTA